MDESHIKVTPLNQIVYSISQQSDSLEVLRMCKDAIVAHPGEIDSLLAVLGYDSLSVESLYNFALSPAIRVFSPDVDSLAPKVSSIENNLRFLQRTGTAEGLNLDRYDYATVVWGKMQSVIFCDSVMFIGLNHYLGENYPGYSGMEAYRRATKNQETLPYDIAEAVVATTMPYQNPARATTINRLVYEGALIEAKMRLVRDADPAKAMGYTRQEYEALLANERWIWDKMISDGMVFDRDVTTAHKLISPAPYCSLLSTQCPGRAGRFIGYRIVRAYLSEHPDSKLIDILSPQFYATSNPLTEIPYRP